MKMMWLMLVSIVFVSFISILVVADIYRFSGSNQNTLLHSLTTLPYSPPQFATNMTLHANVTDDMDGIEWVNFTLASPSGILYIDNENGTRSTEDENIWNSSYLVINQTGTWRYNVTGYDNNSLNTSIPTITGTFTITDNLYISKPEIKETIPIWTNLSYNISLWSSTRENLTYTLSHTLNGINFSVEFNVTTLDVNSTQERSWFVLNITTNSSTTYGNHSGNITITRTWPTYKQVNISVQIGISSNYGDVAFVSPNNYEFISCPGTIYHSMNVTNLGNYRMTWCHPYLYDKNNNEVSSGTDFSLSAGGSAVAQVSYLYGGSSTETTYFAVKCIATPDGQLDTTSATPKIIFTPGSGCQSGNPGGGGGGSAPPTIKEITPPPELKKPTIKDVENACGNDICEEGETPWECPEDCLQRIWEVDQIFCLPLFDCGNWNTSWFLNIMAFVVLVGLVYFQVKKGKVGRRI